MHEQMKNVLNHTSYLRTHAWKLLSGISCACSLHKMVTKSLIITVKSAICTKVIANSYALLAFRGCSIII